MLLPDRGVGIFTMTNLTYTSGRKVAVDLADALDAQGLLPRRPVAPSPQLARARDAVLDLLASWSRDRASALLDVNYASYEPLDALQARLAGIRAAHGACRPGEKTEPENALRGRMRLACERGEVDVSIELTSDAPPRIQALVLEPAMPPSAALVDAAARTVELLGRWDGRAAAALLAPGTDVDATRRLLARVQANHGACRMGDAIRGDGSSGATFRLQCERGEVDLLLARDASSARIAKLDALSVAGSARCPP
jgi:hypothetical protein